MCLICHTVRGAGHRVILAGHLAGPRSPLSNKLDGLVGTRLAGAGECHLSRAVGHRGEGGGLGAETVTFKPSAILRQKIQRSCLG